MFRKTLISEFFTTISFKQALSSLYLMSFGIHKLRYGKDIEEVENKLKHYLGVVDNKIISFYNARSALYHALKIIGISKTDEIIVNAYNCVSVSNAVLQTGANIVYSDINKDDLSFDLEKLKNNITKNTKAIIVQHTFGKTAKIEEIIEIAKEKGIIIIEDCAHSLGTRIGGQQTGTFGDFAIFSTGRDKVISSVTGGFLLVNNNIFFEKIEDIKQKLIMPSRFLTIQNLFYNIVGYKAYKLYDFFKLGRIIIFLSRKLKLITEILSVSEKSCNFKKFDYLLPNSLAYLLSKEIDLLHEYKRERRTKAEYYDLKNRNRAVNNLLIESSKERLNYFRYPILVKDIETKDKLVNYARKYGVILGTSWSGINIAPIGTNLEKAKYKIGSCPVAEDISSRIITLPNHYLINKIDMERIVKLLNNFK